jgi:hypothetical protein
MMSPSAPKRRARSSIGETLMSPVRALVGKLSAGLRRPAEAIGPRIERATFSHATFSLAKPCPRLAPCA